MNVKSGHLKFAEKLEVFHGTTLKTIKNVVVMVAMAFNSYFHF